MTEKIIDVGELYKNHIGLLLGQDNILGLQNPNNFSCSIISYNIGHGIMKVLIKNREGRFFLQLTVVRYFSGFVDWDGANFRLLTNEENIAFTKTQNIAGGMGINAWVIEANSPNGKVSIAATKFDLIFDGYMPEFINTIHIPE